MRAICYKEWRMENICNVDLSWCGLVQNGHSIKDSYLKPLGSCSFSSLFLRSIAFFIFSWAKKASTKISSCIFSGHRLAGRVVNYVMRVKGLGIQLGIPRTVGTAFSFRNGMFPSLSVMIYAYVPTPNSLERKCLSHMPHYESHT